jgi:esterase/lipase superfamily enzyme
VLNRTDRLTARVSEPLQTRRFGAAWVLSCVVAMISISVVDTWAGCDSVSAAALADIESRFAQTSAELAMVSPAERGSQSYRALQERALGELEALQCLQEAQALGEAVPRGLSVTTPFVRVPVLFVTDRQRLETPEGDHRYFSGQRGKENSTSFGRVDVRLPAEGFSQGSSIPIGMTIVNEENAKEGVTVAAPEILDRQEFMTAIRHYREAVPASVPTRALVFIHGFNVTYVDAVAAAARLAFGVGIDAVPIAISWPSQGRIFRYWQDEDAIQNSTEQLRPIFRQLLSEADVAEVIVVAHSMGTRLTTRVLSQLELQKAPLPKLTRLIFAAGDLGEEEFVGLWPRLKTLPSKGWTSYTSSNDFALLASRIIHVIPRIGDSKDRVFAINPMDTIDASAVAPLLRGYGHSYLIDNPALKVDLRHQVSRNLSAAQRGLSKGNRPPAEFWEIRQ